MRNRGHIGSDEVGIQIQAALRKEYELLSTHFKGYHLLTFHQSDKGKYAYLL